MKKITFLLAGLLFLTQGKAQAVSGYVFAQTAETYSPVVGTNATATGDDGAQDEIPIGFNFNYGGTEYSTFSISTNGWIRLGEDIGGNSWVNTLGNPNGYAPLIAVYWDDHNRSTGSIAYAVSGSAPNRVLSVGWDNINISNGGGTSATAFGSFKAMLHETTGIIEFVYGNLTPGGQLSASVGLNDMASFLSVTPSAAPSVSSVTADNSVNGTSFMSGQKYTFTPQPQCSGTPVPGNTQSNMTTVCENVVFVLQIENTFSDFGISYQWQSSGNGTDFTNIADATAPVLLMTQTQSTYYRCTVNCGGNSGTSTAVQVIQTPSAQCYCFPTYDNGKTDGDLISNVVIPGTTLANNTGTAPVDPFYTYFTGEPNLTATLESGFSYQMTVSVGTYGQQEIAVWIDYNDDYEFSENEKIGYTQEQVAGSGSGTFTITLSCDAPLGTHRMRIRDVWNSDASAMDPCANYGYGETEDYDITIIAATTCEIPLGLGINNIGTSSAELAWQTGCGQLSWDVHVAEAGAGLPTGTPNHGNVESGVLVSELLPFTAYEFYVRTHCQLTGTSDWAGPFAFTTLALAVANDDCQTATELIAGDSFEENAIVATNVGATKTLGQPNPTCGIFGFGGDVWFSVVVPADGNLTLEVQEDPGSPLIDTAMSVFSGTCEELTTLGCSDDEGIGAFSKLSLTGLTPGATIYARVWEYANDVFGTFKVSAYNPTLKAQNFDDAHFGFEPNPVKDVLNLSYHKKMTDVAVFNLLGQQVLTSAVDSNQAKIDLSQLQKGAYLVKINAENQTKTIKIIKE